MKIGTVRPEEAKVSDGFAGYHSFHNDEVQDEDSSLEVFWHDGGYIEIEKDPGVDILPVAGWYWWARFPGHPPESNITGPFASSRQALQDAGVISVFHTRRKV